MTVICASLVTGILLSLTQGKAAQGVMKLLSGIFLTLTLLDPLTSLDWEEMLSLPDPSAAEAMAAAGENMAKEALGDIIKQECETYIRDKATDLHENVQVEILLSEGDPPVPVAAVLTGRVSPYGKSRIEGILLRDLGIPKEKVEWRL